MKNWHNKHIGTQAGIAILGFFLIVTALLIPVLGKQQNLFSNAAAPISCTQKHSCKLHDLCEANGAHGTCEVKVPSSTSVFIPGYCPNTPTNVQCKIARTASPSCGPTSIGSGRCQSTSIDKGEVNGLYMRGYCPGSSTYQCYVSNDTIIAKIDNHMNAMAPNCYKKIGTDGKHGICVNTHNFSGSKNLIGGLCPGPDDLKCYVAK